MNKNNKQPTTQINWSTLLIISLISIAMGVYRDGIASLFPFLQRDFSLTRAQLGLYITFVYLTSSSFSLFSGRMVDLKGAKWGLISGGLFIGILLILHSIAPNLWALLVLAALSGIGMSINPSAANKGLTEWFHKKWLSTATGIWSTAYPIGGLLAATLLPFLGIHLGWRRTIVFSGMLVLLCSFLVWQLYQNKPGDNLCKDDNVASVPFWKEIGQLIRNKDLMAISVYAFFLGTAGGAIITHFTLFLYLDFGLSESVAGIGFAFSQLGSILGRPGWGLICDKFLETNRNKAFLFMGCMFALVTIFFGLILKNTNPSLSIIFFFSFLAGCSGRGWDGIFFSSICDIVNNQQVGIAIGFSLFFLRTGILLSPPIFGFIADLRNSYDLSWLILGLLLLLASIYQYLFYKKRNSGK